MKTFNTRNTNMQDDTPRDHNLVRPVALLELYEHFRTWEAVGKELGFSGAALATNARENCCRKSTELAAQHVLAKINSQKAGKEKAVPTITYVVRVPDDESFAPVRFQAMCETLGLSLARLVEEPAHG